MGVMGIPVLVWQGRAGAWAAALVEDPLVACLGGTPEHALARLEDRMRCMPASEPCLLGGPHLHHVRVPGAAWLRVPVVTAVMRDGATLVSMPTLGVCQVVAGVERGDVRGSVLDFLREVTASRGPLGLCGLESGPVRLESLALRMASRRPPVARPEGLPALESVADPVVGPWSARAFPVVLEREEELADLEARLRPARGSILLVGEPGVGKTTLLVEVARRLEKGRTSSREGRHRFWMTCAARLLAGMRYLGQWEERCEQVVDDLARIRGVLCVESLLDLVGRGARVPSQGLAAFLGPYMERGEVCVVAEATPRELDACRRMLPHVVDLFTVVRVPPLSSGRALAVLRGMAGTLGRRLDVAVDEAVAPATQRLFARFEPYAPFPGAAGRFLAGLLEAASGRGQRSLEVSDAVAAFSEQTGLPLVLLEDGLPLTLADVVDRLAARVLGQEEACRVVAERVLAFKAGLDDPERPLGVLLFCGPTGVGKTEMARALAGLLFGAGAEGSARRLVRLDMSEYGLPGAAARLVGDLERPGMLVREVRAQPFSVVLLDEIEKAAPEVFDVLLGLCDEGRLADSLGRVTTFRSSLVIMTSNLGSATGSGAGLGPREAPRYEAEVRTWFRPEFFNRIDAVVRFHPLGVEALRALVRRELRGVACREGLQREGLELSWTPALEEHLVRHGTDVRSGARPLQRAVESLVVAPLARLLVAEPWARGARIEVDVSERGAVVLRRMPGAS